MKKVLLTLATILAMTNMIDAEERIISPDGTYMYAKKDTCELFLDIYNPSDGSETTYLGKTKPTILFMFGGGFAAGERDNEFYLPWFKLLVDNGFTVISIDYRLGLKDKQGVGIGQVKVFENAIYMAVEDLFSATSYIIENAESLEVDPKNIIISGSSAGAVSALQADYNLSNRTKYAKELPRDFQYAGVISFAGGIFSRKGKLKYAESPAPTLFLHGTADRVVSYKQIKFFNLGFFGSDKIAERFTKFDYNYNIIRYAGNGHEIAGAMVQSFDKQLVFIYTNIMGNEKRIIDATVNDPSIEKGTTPTSLKEIYKNNDEKEVD